MASKSTSKAKRTRRAKKQNEYQAGKPGDLNSFITVFNVEPSCAAYLGYDDIGAFRKLQLSSDVLDFANVWARLCGGTKTAVEALEVIRDLRNHDTDERFPQDIKATIAKYGPEAPLRNPEADQKLQESERARNAKYLRATLIFRLAQRLEVQDHYSEKEGRARQEAAIKQFSQVHPHLRFPTGLTYDDVTTPELGPHTDMGEDVLEKYNRCYNLLRSVGQLTVLSRWKEKLESGDPFPTRTVDPSYIPRWMVSAKRRITTAPDIPKFPQKKIMLVHDVRTRSMHTESLKSHEEEFIQYHGLSLPNLEQSCLKDPRYFTSGPQWRDTLRRQLNFQDLRVELFTLALVIPNADAEEAKRLKVYGPGQNLTPWEEVRSLLTKDADDATFVYTLRPLDDGEDFEVEYTGPPLALAEDFHLDAGGDVAQIPFQTPADDNDGTAVDEAEEAENLAFLTGGGLADKKPPTPEAEFPPNEPGMREKMLQQHNGYDVWTPKGLRDWQTMVINKVALGHGALPKARKQVPFRGSRKIDATQRQALATAEQDGERQALSTDTPEMNPDGRYYKVHAAFSGTTAQVGPYVDDSKAVLGMKDVGKFKDTDLNLSQCTALPRCTASFLDSQVTAAAFILQRTFGVIPIDQERRKDKAVRDAATRLQSVRTRGGIVADVTGLGKTDESLLALSYLALYGEHSGREHRPHLLAVPNGPVLGQWADKIFEQYGDLDLIISSDERPTRSRYEEHWVSATAMREAPTSVRNWPSHLHYVFNLEDRRASRTVILTPYDSHAARTLDEVWVDKGSEARQNVLAVPDCTTKNRKRVMKERRQRKNELQNQEPIFSSKWRGRFESVWLRRRTEAGLRRMETKSSK